MKVFIILASLLFVAIAVSEVSPEQRAREREVAREVVARLKRRQEGEEGEKGCPKEGIFATYASKDFYTCARITMMCGNGFQYFGSEECGCGCMKQVQVSSKCDAKSEDYLATSIRECQKSTFICTEEKERFDNDCGCGCREKKNEEKAMACTRDQQCGRFGSCLDAHKDDCHPLCGGQNCKKQCYVESKQVCGGDLPMQCKDGMICVDDPSDTCHSGCQMKPMSVGEDPVAKESDPLIYPPPPIADCPGICVRPLTKDVSCKKNPDVDYVNQDPQECAQIKFFCEPGFTPIFDKCGCGCMEEEKEPCEKDPHRQYLSQSVEECKKIAFLCEVGYNAFYDECGCGCKYILDIKKCVHDRQCGRSGVCLDYHLDSCEPSCNENCEKACYAETTQACGGGTDSATLCPKGMVCIDDETDDCTQVCWTQSLPLEYASDVIEPPATIMPPLADCPRICAAPIPN